MLLHVNCIEGEVEYTVAFNSDKVVCITEMKPGEHKAKCFILDVTGRTYLTDEDYLSLVARFNKN